MSGILFFIFASCESLITRCYTLIRNQQLETRHYHYVKINMLIGAEYTYVTYLLSSYQWRESLDEKNTNTPPLTQTHPHTPPPKTNKNKQTNRQTKNKQTKKKPLLRLRLTRTIQDQNYICQRFFYVYPKFRYDLSLIFSCLYDI